jgi:hypothetical protein
MAHRDTLMPNHRQRHPRGKGRATVSKKGRKKRSRKRNNANHGKRPNT